MNTHSTVEHGLKFVAFIIGR